MWFFDICPYNVYTYTNVVLCNIGACSGLDWRVGSCLYLFIVFKSSKGLLFYLNSIRYIFRDLYTNMLVYSIGGSRGGRGYGGCNPLPFQISKIKEQKNRRQSCWKGRREKMLHVCLVLCVHTLIRISTNIFSPQPPPFEKFLDPRLYRSLVMVSRGVLLIETIRSLIYSMDF